MRDLFKSFKIENVIECKNFKKDCKLKDMITTSNDTSNLKSQSPRKIGMFKKSNDSQNLKSSSFMLSRGLIKNVSI